VLYVGLRHLDEARIDTDDERHNNWMAAVLSQLTDYDPLTIDQVSGSGIGPDDVALGTQAVHAHFDINEPSVFLDRSGNVVRPPESRWSADIVLFSPIETSAVAGARPNWLRSLPGRSLVAVDISSIDQRPIVVQAFRHPTIDRALAADQYAVLESETINDVQLALNSGQYAIEIQTPSGQQVLLETLTVPEE